MIRRIYIMKMRVLYSSSNKKIVNYAVALGEAQNDQHAIADTIPPAYSCDRERLVVLVISTGARVEDNVRLFISELTPARAANVVFVFDSKDGKITPPMQQLIDAAKAAGTNVLVDNTYFVAPGSLFSSKISMEERSGIVDWCESIKEAVK